MNSRSTWFWLSAALALLVIVMLNGRWSRPAAPGPTKVLAELRPAAITAIQIRHRGQLEVIRAERTNSVWRLTKPVDYSAQSASIESLLAALDRLTPTVYLSPHERRSHPRADEEEGLSQPQSAIFLQQGERTFQIDIGTNTPPGDQFYLQVAGDAGAYIVDAEFLKFLPRTQDDWRSRGLLDLKDVVFDRVAVTNGSRVLELQRSSASTQWRIVNPSQARADAERLKGMLLDLEALRVSQFISDSPKPSLDAFGLQPPDLEIALAHGTNLAVLLQFGKSPTNDLGSVYARRAGQDTIVTVPTNGLERWRASVGAFRDPHLINLPAQPVVIDVRADEKFSIQRQGTNAWQVLPQNLPVDPAAVRDLLSVLSESPIVEFKDAVTPLDLPKFGLSPAVRQYILRVAGPASPATNPVLVELDFGFTNENKVYVSRADEISSVYAIPLPDFQRLPSASLQLHTRRLWQYNPDEVERAVITQAGKVRQMIHSGIGPIAWSLGQSSPGTIEPLGVNETIKALGQFQVTNWLARGEESRVRYGLAPPSGQLTVHLKNGNKSIVELGAATPAGSLYGAVNLSGELWIFEFPAWLAQWMDRFLSIPP